MTTTMGTRVTPVGKLKKQYPDQPWRHTKEWNSGRINDNCVAEIFLWGFFALFWNGISWTAFVAILSDDSAGTEALFFISIFLVIGAALLVPFVRSIIFWRKFGASVFELAENPGVIGGSLGGIVHTRKNIRPRDGFKVSLMCIERVVSGSGKNQSTRETVLWESPEQTVHDAAAGNLRTSRLPVLFDIPYDCPETSVETPRRQTVWMLRVKAELPGMDFAAQFAVPVFKTKDSNPALTESRGSKASEATSSKLTTSDWHQRGITIRDQSRQRLEIEISGRGKWMFAVGPIVVGIGLIALAIFLTTIEVPVLIPPVVAIFATVLLAFALLILFAKVRVTVTPRLIRANYRLILVSWSKDIRLTSETWITLKAGVQSNNSQTHFISISNGTAESLILPTLLTERGDAMSLIAEINAVRSR